MTGSKRQDISGKVQRDYVLHDPPLRYLQGTLENYGHQWDDERYNRIEGQVSEQMKQTKLLKRNALKESKMASERPKSSISAKRDYILHAPRFRDLQENYMRYYNRPTTADQTKSDVIRKKRLSAAIKRKKNELIEMRKTDIDELKSKLDELQEMNFNDMTNQELIEHRQQIASIRARIQREEKDVRYDFLPQSIPRTKLYKPDPVLDWNNPPQYDRNAPQLRHVMEVNEIYGAHMDAARKAILDRTMEHILSNQEEYAAWKRQM